MFFIGDDAFSRDEPELHPARRSPIRFFIMWQSTALFLVVEECHEHCYAVKLCPNKCNVDLVVEHLSKT